MTVRPELAHDLNHASLEESHAGVEDRIEHRHAAIKGGEAGVQRAHHLRQCFETASGRLRLVLDLAGETNQSTLNRSQSHFNSSQAIAPVVIHQSQRTASAYPLRQRIVFELEP